MLDVNRTCANGPGQSPDIVRALQFLERFFPFAGLPWLRCNARGGIAGVEVVTALFPWTFWFAE